jgi:hypothetical protein
VKQSKSNRTNSAATTGEVASAPAEPVHGPERTANPNQASEERRCTTQTTSASLCARSATDRGTKFRAAPSGSCGHRVVSALTLGPMTSSRLSAWMPLLTSWTILCPPYKKLPAERVLASTNRTLPETLELILQFAGDSLGGIREAEETCSQIGVDAPFCSVHDDWGKLSRAHAP